MNMKKIILFTLVSFLLTSCFTMQKISEISNLSEDELNEIPNEAKEVLIKKECSAKDLYNDIYDILIDKGHRINKSDEDRYYITTEGRDVGESTLQRMTISVKEDDNIANAKILTDWKAGSAATAGAQAATGLYIQSDWQPAKWEISRLGNAFAETVYIAKQVENSEISYKGQVKKEPTPTKKTQSNTPGR
jgi:hypothetical protein